MVEVVLGRRPREAFRAADEPVTFTLDRLETNPRFRPPSRGRANGGDPGEAADRHGRTVAGPH